MLLTNSFEGITPSGTAITTGNSGGASGSAFDAVQLGTGAAVTSDSAHAHRGALSCHVTTGGTAAQDNVLWSTSAGTLTQSWFRLYLYFTANPAATTQVYSAFNVGGGTECAALSVNTSGTLRFDNSTGSPIITTTTAIATGQWVRIEGFITGSATVGQLELKLFNTPDSLTPDETHTSTAAQNTAGPLAFYNFGTVGAAANVSYWLDDLGLSSTGYPGPAVTPGSYFNRQQAVQAAATR